MAVKTENKILKKSQTNKIWLGICGGVGEYFGMDPVIIRIIWILAVVFTGFFPGLIAYLLAGFIIPKS
jgi:phage shock protein C